MVTRIGGSRRKTRSQMTKDKRAKGKISLSSYFKVLKKGDKVALKAEPAVQKGIFFRRFYGRIGTIKAKKGRCYEVQIKDRKAEKTLIVHPVHLIKL